MALKFNNAFLTVCGEVGIQYTYKQSGREATITAYRLPSIGNQQGSIVVSEDHPPLVQRAAVTSFSRDEGRYKPSKQG